MTGASMTGDGHTEADMSVRVDAGMRAMGA